jgi:hypothetical protein
MLTKQNLPCVCNSIFVFCFQEKEAVRSDSQASASATEKEMWILVDGGKVFVKAYCVDMYRMAKVIPSLAYGWFFFSYFS